MEIVCEGRVFILWVVYTHNFHTSSEEKGQTSSSEEGEKKFWCGACQAIVFEEVQTEKESQPAPSHASRCPFRGNKKSFIRITRSHLPLIDPWGFLASRSQGHHPPFSNKSNISGYSVDEKCKLCMEGCKGAVWGARVPPYYERATMGCPFVREPLSGSQKI